LSQYIDIVEARYNVSTNLALNRSCITYQFPIEVDQYSKAAS